MEDRILANDSQYQSLGSKNILGSRSIQQLSYHEDGARAELGRGALSRKLRNSSHSVTSGMTPAARHGLQVGPSQGDATEQETAATEARPPHGAPLDPRQPWGRLQPD